MRSKRFPLIGALTAILSTAALTSPPVRAQSAGTIKVCGFSPIEWSANLARSTKQRRGEPLPFTYPNLLFAISMIDLAERTGDLALRTYAEGVVNRFVNADGSLTGFPPTGFGLLETIPAGRIFLRMHGRTGDDRYRKAAASVRELMKTLPRTADGVFAWRPGQIWLDGIWHTLPFYAEYGRQSGERDAFEDIRRQFAAVVSHNGNAQTGLLSHGWDERREQFWADPKTGRSQAMWTRAIGWYAMALVDVLDDVPPEHALRAYLIRLLDDVTQAVIKYQDQSSGLWYQVLDRPGAAGNYLEASASSMFVYAIARGVNRGHLDRRFSTAATKGYAGLIRDKVGVDPQRRWTLHDIVRSAGLGAPPDWPPGSPPPSKRDAQPRGRDGSFEYYVEQPVVSDHSYGVGPFVLAGLEVDTLLSKATVSREASGFAQVECRTSAQPPNK